MSQATGQRYLLVGTKTGVTLKKHAELQVKNLLFGKFYSVYLINIVR